METKELVETLLPHSRTFSHLRRSAAMPLDLSEINTEDLVHEVQRRLECLNKPEKRLILIGENIDYSAREKGSAQG